MQALNAVALTLWLAQVLAHVYKLRRSRIEVMGIDSGMELVLNYIHALVSGLCVVCFLGAAGTLPYQQQRRSAGLDGRRNAEIAFGAIFGTAFGVASLFTWSIS